MKWIRRKPSLRVHTAVLAIACILIAYLPRLVHKRFDQYESNFHRWGMDAFGLSALDQAHAGLRKQGNLRERYTIDRKVSPFRIWSYSDNRFFFREELYSPVTLAHWAGEFESGLWAPTRWHKAELLIDSHSFPGIANDWSIDPPTQREREIQAALVADRNLDAGLATAQHIERTGVIPFGYFVNTLWLIAIAGLLWWSWWVPAQIRDYRAEKRRAKDLCPVCLYDVCATPGKCPECGWRHEEEAGEA